MNTIKELRVKLNMTQKEFSERFGIPLGTLRNWEQGVSNPPSYIFTMILANARRDYMLNIETVRFMKLLDDLAELTLAGFDDFVNATEENYNSKIFYDSNTEDEDGRCRIVLMSCVIDDGEHHDIISYYDDDEDEYTVRSYTKQVDEYDIPFVEIKFSSSDDQIVIENGKWYFV